MSGKTYLVIGTITFILLIVFAVGLILFVLDRRDKHKEKQEKTEPEITEKIYPPDLQPEKKKNIRPFVPAIVAAIILVAIIIAGEIKLAESFMIIGFIGVIVFIIIRIVLFSKKNF